MFERLFARPRDTRLKDVKIADGNLTIDLPVRMEIKEEEADTIVVIDPSYPAATIRFSVLYVSDDKNPNNENLGIIRVTKIAQERRKGTVKVDGKCYFRETGYSEEEGVKLEVHYWTVGFINSLVIISCCIVDSAKKTQSTREMHRMIETAIASLRFSKIVKYKPTDQDRYDMFPLSEEHSKYLDVGRQVVYSSGLSHPNKLKFLGTEADLTTLQIILDANIQNKTYDSLFEGIGIVFGDILAKKLPLRWVTVVDYVGPTPALKAEDAELLIYAKDMIIKRVAAEENTDLVDMYNTLVGHFQQMINTKV